MEPILDPAYWRERLESATSQNDLHLSVFRCPLERWKAIEAKHQSILFTKILETDSILDCGCGYGRLLELMPYDWNGPYLGVDISPDFVDLARKRWPNKLFNVASLLDLSGFHGGWEWAVLISIRPMIRRNLGVEVWNEMELQIRMKAKRLLYLEYDPDDEGSVE